jgi:hypothetical protein
MDANTEISFKLDFSAGNAAAFGVKSPTQPSDSSGSKTARFYLHFWGDFWAYFRIWIIGPITEISSKLDFSAENATAFRVKSLHATEQLDWFENRSMLSAFLGISERISV